MSEMAEQPAPVSIPYDRCWIDDKAAYISAENGERVTFKHYEEELAEYLSERAT